MPRVKRRLNPGATEAILQQMLRRDAKLLVEAKVLAVKDDADLLTPRQRLLAEAARSPHPRTPWFLHDASQKVELAMKREQTAADRPQVFIVVSDPLALPAWEQQAHKIQAQHENERLRELTGVIDVVEVEAKKS